MSACFAVICWVVAGAALVSHLLGNPTAINGVLGAGIMAIVLTACAVLDR